MTEDYVFLDWMCKKSEGFEYHQRCMKDGMMRFIDVKDMWDGLNIDSDVFRIVVYPLLLQRAIERVNKREEDIHIVQNHIYLTVMDWEWNTIEKWDLLSPDQAKESALRYIYEKENSNDE